MGKNGSRVCTSLGARSHNKQITDELTIVLFQKYLTKQAVNSDEKHTKAINWEKLAEKVSISRPWSHNKL